MTGPFDDGRRGALAPACGYRWQGESAFRCRCAKQRGHGVEHECVCGERCPMNGPERQDGPGAPVAPDPSAGQQHPSC